VERVPVQVVQTSRRVGDLARRVLGLDIPSDGTFLSRVARSPASGEIVGDVLSPHNAVDVDDAQDEIPSAGYAGQV